MPLGATVATDAGVRGTSFFIKTVDAKTTSICCCNGEVRTAGVSVTDSTLMYHTGADMETAAAAIGEAIDWTKPDR